MSLLTFPADYNGCWDSLLGYVCKALLVVSGLQVPRAVLITVMIGPHSTAAAAAAAAVSAQALSPCHSLAAVPCPRVWRH